MWIFPVKLLHYQNDNGSRIKFVPKVKVILKSEIKVLLSKKTNKKEILSSFIKILNYKAS